MVEAMWGGAGGRAKLSAAAGLALLAAALPAGPVRADSVEDFYRGKQINLLVGSGAGGGYDAYARVFARHFGKHVPGHPSIIAKNLPAGGGMAAANTLANTSDKDGLTIAAHTNGIAMDPLFGNPGAKFDGRAFHWLGSIGKLQNVCAVWHLHPVKTIEQARTLGFTAAGAGATSNTVIVPKILNTLIGTKIKVIAGYEPGQGDAIAMESGEVDGVCGLAWSTIKASRAHWINEKKITVLVQMAFDKLPDLPDTPSALDLVSNDADRKVLELILIRQEMGRPFSTPPGVPAERVAALRRAFDATMKDPDFIAEAARAQLEIEPLTGEQIETLLAGAYAAPKDIVQRASALINPAASAK
ncbi:MAG: tripartite tricarboxylate transporter substrate-binding protein [Beijerinckiaceae bacterium]|nr:tripartite tricarboxylate transporter substrate-binding protein [Beijerinckiaceae bacterium]